MYKIVQTTERGKSQLSIVPEAWESHGILYWPKLKADKLVKDAKSKPSDNWFQMQCTVKRLNLTSFEVAETEMNKMLLHDDTDDCEPSCEPSTQIRKRPKVHQPTTVNDFNSLVQSCTKSSTTTSNKSTQNTISPLLSQQQEDSNLHNLFLEPTESLKAQPMCMKSSTIQQLFNLNPSSQTSESLNSYNLIVDSTPVQEQVEIQDFSFQIPPDNSEKIDKILNNQDIIIKNQKTILNVLSSQSIMLEEFFKKFENHENSQSVNSSINCKVDSFLKDFKPIDSLHDINELESKLKQGDTMNVLVEKLSFICGKSGKEHGLNTCYTIVDNLFTRKFMTLCSWAGGSRGDMEKIPFKIYKNTIHFFFKLVKLADNDFTLENCEQFFKNILKNATRRNEINTFARSSKCKNRPKKLTYKKRNELVERVESNDESKESTSVTEMIDKEITDGEQSTDSSKASQKISD